MSKILRPNLEPIFNNIYIKRYNMSNGKAVAYAPRSSSYEQKKVEQSWNSLWKALIGLDAPLPN
jgi:hypothetical protein